MQTTGSGYPSQSERPDRQDEIAAALAALAASVVAPALDLPPSGGDGAGVEGSPPTTGPPSASPGIPDVVAEPRPQVVAEPLHVWTNDAMPAADMQSPTPPAVSAPPPAPSPLATITPIAPQPAPPVERAPAIPAAAPDQHPALTPPAPVPSRTPGSVPSIGDVRPGAPRFAETPPQPARVPSPRPEPTLDAPPQPRSAPAPQSPPATTTARRGWSLGGVLRRAVRYVAMALAAYLAAVAVLVVVFRWVDPPMSALMLIRAAGGQAITQSWVPLSAVSPNLVRAVVVSEDARFCTHHGIDLGEMKAAIERAKDGIPRGASTISMQLAKNLFLWPSKSYVRKAIELPLTLYIEAVWPKWRIFEVYINIAEWGPGIFGAEAAARHHFDKPASRIYEYEAALLAVSLPNPFDRDAGDPGPQTERLASRIEARMRSMTRATQCIETFVGAPKPAATRLR